MNSLPRLAALLLALSSLPSCCLFRVRPPEYDPVILENGLVIQDEVVPEEGPLATAGDTVSIHYVMRLGDGEVVDSSLERARPVSFVLGEAQVPKGLDLGIVGMRCFGRRRLVVPPLLAYGDEGYEPLVPPNATLYVSVELLELLSPERPPYP